MAIRILDVQDYIFAVIVARNSDDSVRGVEGTGFMLPGGIFVTCWHCVCAPLPAGERYVAGRRLRGGGYDALELSMLAQDENGTDLALARLPDAYRPPNLLELGGVEIMDGMEVGTYGCSLPEKNADGSGFITHSRTLRGYITRAVVHQRPNWGPTPSFELDMPAPEGVSGAPLLVIAPTGTRVIGVVYGTHGAHKIEEFASIDPVTKERRPEVQKIYTFGMAHDLQVLSAARGPATDRKPLAEYVTARVQTPEVQ